MVRAYTSIIFKSSLFRHHHASLSFCLFLFMPYALTVPVPHYDLMFPRAFFPCRALICKVSTFPCVCVVWFVVIGSLFLIRPTLTKLSLYCHIWALLGSRTYGVNLIQGLIVLNVWQTWLSFFFLFAVSFYLSLSLSLSCISPSIPSHPLLFPFCLPGSDTNGGMER